MSSDPKRPSTRIPVVGADAAPSGYVDYIEWAFHPYSDGETRTRRITLMLGRYATIPRERAIGPAPEGEEVEPPSMQEKAVIQFVAEMSGDMLRIMRADIDQILGDANTDDPPPQEPFEKVH